MTHRLRRIAATLAGLAAIFAWLSDAAVGADAAIDIVLSGGAFVGRVVDDSGRSLADVDVLIQRGGKDQHRQPTNDDGWFRIQLSPGQYDVVADGIRGTYRVWPERLAPPAAGQTALLVRSRRGGRSTFQPATGDQMLLATVGVIVTVIAAAIAVDQIHRLPPTVEAAAEQQAA